MPKLFSQQCYRLLISTTPDFTGAVADLAKCILEGGSASAVAHHVGEPALRTLLVSDLVGSTATLHKLGDNLGREYIARHDDLVRSCLRLHLGVEIAHTGDGIIASFASPSRALHCACAMQEAAARYNQSPSQVPMHIRIGLHAGRPIVQDGRLLGGCVNTAVRVCSNATGGLILATQQVVDFINPHWFRLIPRGGDNASRCPRACGASRG